MAVSNRDPSHRRTPLGSTLSIYLAVSEGREISPGEDVRTDREIDEFIRSAAGSGFHPCCTCRMGTDALAVCTPDLRVRGLEGLRVADSLVFPSKISANLNVSTFMLAERASDLIGGRPLLSELQLPVLSQPQAPRVNECTHHRSRAR